MLAFTLSLDMIKQKRFLKNFWLLDIKMTLCDIHYPLSSCLNCSGIKKKWWLFVSVACILILLSNVTVMMNDREKLQDYSIFTTSVTSIFVVTIALRRPELSQITGSFSFIKSFKDKERNVCTLCTISHNWKKLFL